MQAAFLGTILLGPIPFHAEAKDILGENFRRILACHAEGYAEKMTIYLQTRSSVFSLVVKSSRARVGLGQRLIFNCPIVLNALKGKLYRVEFFHR